MFPLGNKVRFHLFLPSEGSCIGLRFEPLYFEALHNLS